MESVCIQITDQPLDIEAACDFVDSAGAGATNLFIGRVRNNHEGNDVTGITYDIHKVLAEKTLREICTEAEGLWPETRYYVAHYTGELPVGGMTLRSQILALGADDIIFVGDTDHDRRAAEAVGCRFVWAGWNPRVVPTDDSEVARRPRDVVSPAETRAALQAFGRGELDAVDVGAWRDEPQAETGERPMPSYRYPQPPASEITPRSSVRSTPCNAWLAP